MNDTEADATVEITLNDEDMKGEDLRFAGTTYVADVTIDPGFPGRGSMYTAASDIDYYGQPPGVEDTLGVRVRREDGSEREATKEEREAFLRWADTHDEQFNAAAVEAWGGGEDDGPDPDDRDR